jgi:hypothetical protein
VICSRVESLAEVRGKPPGTRNHHFEVSEGNHYLSAKYAMHLHTMRALFASHDAFSALFVSCIQPQLQGTVLLPGILYESCLSASLTCHKNNLHPIGDLRLLMLT